MDAVDPEHIGHGHRTETSLLPLKKRASNYSSGGGRISAAGDPYVSSPSKKKQMAGNNVVAAEIKDTTGALDAPVPPCQRRPVPAAASREPVAELPAPPAVASPEPVAEGIALSESGEENKQWISKGKWLAREDSISLVTRTPQPPVNKLMHDGIRSFIPEQLRDEHRRRHAAAEADDGDVSLSLHGSSPALSSALKRRLAELGATQPWLVHSKTLKKSDVTENQNRLLVSCKRGSGTKDCPITGCFSPAEMERVNMNVGLAVTALDRDGVAYALTCKFLTSNSGYRFISEWKHFLIQNGINLACQKHKVWTRDVEVELWAFRSHQLPFQLQIDDEGKVVTKKVDGKDVNQLMSHHLDPNGALGLLLLHHENRKRRVKSEEDDDDDNNNCEGPSSSPTVVRKKGKHQQGVKRGAPTSSASVLASPVALPRPAAMHREMFYAAIGLLKLQQANWDRWKKHANQKQDAKGLSNNVAKSPTDVEGEKIDIKK